MTITNWYIPVEVLKQATSINAQLFALLGLNPYPDEKLGMIEEGAYANLLSYDANPLENTQIIIDFEDSLN